MYIHTEHGVACKRYLCTYSRTPLGESYLCMGYSVHIAEHTALGEIAHGIVFERLVPEPMRRRLSVLPGERHSHVVEVPFHLAEEGGVLSWGLASRDS